MPLQSLQTYNFRNLSDVKIELDPGLQLVYGDNASGKTSLLDAMHVLCCAKSFLGASPRKLLQFQQDSMSLNGVIQQPDINAMPVQFRWQASHIQLSAGHKAIRRTSDYASYQPVQSITPLSYRIIDDTPETRRRFMDWGVFHVKPAYIDDWRNFQRSLAHRNSMLRSGADKRALSAWNQEFIDLAKRVDDHRSSYVSEYQLTFNTLARNFFPHHELTIEYYRGWDQEKELLNLLEDSVSKDIERRYTLYGPQRADITIRLNQRPARDVASRGQKKLITFALYLSQSQFQQQSGSRGGMLLIDDLPSELDHDHQGQILDFLTTSPAQIVISCIDRQQVNISAENVKKLFHVKQGKVKEVIQ